MEYKQLLFRARLGELVEIEEVNDFRELMDVGLRVTKTLVYMGEHTVADVNVYRLAENVNISFRGRIYKDGMTVHVTNAGEEEWD